MNMQPVQMSEVEIRFRRHHSCFNPGCRNVSFLKDWSGWVWCLKHYWRELWSIEQKNKRLWFIRHTEFC